MRSSYFTFFVVLLFLSLSAYGLAAQTLQSSNLPIIVINTNGGVIVNEPKITADMGIIYNGNGVQNNITDPFNNYNGKIGIEIRGASSQMFPKKQFGIELRDATGGDIAVSLLGMPAEEDWVLSALYNDKSLIRDALAYKLARDVGHYAPRTMYCEVVLNGTYHGVYMLIEKIKRDKNRVDISNLEPQEISGSDLTGGYIIKLDKSDGNSGPGWSSAYRPRGAKAGQAITFQYEYPKFDEIVPQQKQYIQNYVAMFEKSLAENFGDPVEGYERYIDLPSFVDYFVINEVSKNVDGYRLSTFMHKKKDSDGGGKLYMGPVWDYNLGFGNANYCTSGTTDGFVFASFNAVCPMDNWQIPFWWNQLFNDINFSQKASDRWVSLRQNKFKTSTVHAYIDSIATLLDHEAQQRNFQRWPELLGRYIWPNYYVGPTFQSEVKWLKDWIAARMLWLDGSVPNLITATAENPRQALSLSVFPNPFTSAIEFDYEIEDAAGLMVEAFDLTGRKIEFIGKEQSVKGRYRWEAASELPDGIYLYKISVNQKQISAGKLMKISRHDD